MLPEIWLPTWTRITGLSVPVARIVEAISPLSSFYSAISGFVFFINKAVYDTRNTNERQYQYNVFYILIME